MIYKSIDTIPSKLYFKIIETSDYSLLCSSGEKVPEEELIQIFEKIRLEDEKIYEGSGKENSKELNIYAKIENLATKYKKVKFAVYYLRHIKDEELIEVLKKDGYKFTEDFEKSLDAIERVVESLLVKIEVSKNRLPKRKEASEEIPFDEVVLSYCALLGMGFVDTNKVVQSQFRAIIKMGNNKIEKLNKMHDGRK